MPRLVPNPDQALLATIRELKSRVQALETRRSANRPACAVLGPTSTVYAAGLQTLDLTATVFDTHGMVDLGGNLVTIPFTGIWQLSVDVPASYSGTFQDTVFYVNNVDTNTDLKVMLSPLNTTMASTFFLVLTQGDRLRIRFNPTMGSTGMNQITWGLEMARKS